MNKLDLRKAAEVFEMISDEHQLFYNIKTGDFDFCIDSIYTGIDDDEFNVEKFEDDNWISAPRRWDINEYNIMVDFSYSVKNPQNNELLCAALEGRGAFRRFKDTLHRVDLSDEWYDFKHRAFIEIARKWCEANDIEYIRA